MKEYILSLLPRLSQFSKGLNNSAILVDQPWIFLNEQGQQTKFVFRPNQELLVSINGAVQKGRWEYLTAMDALLIEHGNQTQLFSQAFIDKGILVLNKDNTSELFVLINSNVIPDLDFVKYLDDLTSFFKQEPNTGFKLVKMKYPPIKVKIYPEKSGMEFYSVNSHITSEDGAKLKDGKLHTMDSKMLLVKNSKIIQIIDTANQQRIVALTITLLLIVVLLTFFWLRR